VQLAARETVFQGAEPQVPSSEGIDSPRGEPLREERLFSKRGGRDKGRGRRVAVVRRSSSVLTDLLSGRFARPVAADEFGSRAVETVFGLASPSEIRIHPARGLRGP